MRRRDVIAGGAAAAFVGHVAIAQTPIKAPRLGMLRYGSPQDDRSIEPFLAAMRSLGYLDGRTVNYDYRHAGSDASKLPALANELVMAKPDVMMAFGGDLAPYVSDATRSIPIVFSVSADPVRLGLVASPNWPERNATGVTFLHEELGSKRLQLLKEAAPQVAHVAFLWNPEHPDNELDHTSRAAQALNMKLLSLPVRTVEELQPALQQATNAGVDSVYVVTSTLIVNSMSRIVGFASNRRLPLAGGWGAWASAGGLMSYGPDVNSMLARTAAFVDKILKGAKPADLPVEQPTKFELTINMTAAKALGLKIPESYLVRADHIIEQ